MSQQHQTLSGSGHRSIVQKAISQCPVHCGVAWDQSPFFASPLFYADVAVTSQERERAKKVTYGIIYGLSAWGLGQGPAGLGMPVAQAQALITSFLNHFSGVSTWLLLLVHQLSC